MPAPKRPNTEAASAVVRRRGQETAAAKLGAAGWLVIAPESVAAVRELIQQAKDRGELVEWHIDLQSGEQTINEHLGRRGMTTTHNLPDQPDGISDQSTDLPALLAAAERITAYIAASGDGLYDVCGGAPLYARDLEALSRTALRTAPIKSGPAPAPLTGRPPTPGQWADLDFALRRSGGRVHRPRGRAGGSDRRPALRRRGWIDDTDMVTALGRRVVSAFTYSTNTGELTAVR